ncbi:MULTISPECIES: amino acid adenylation domain-containing protein [unclassified Bradyrhizobium]|uniref:amino acid adenylation domain-containing protein n=1 Tax=unclassified Bradyrhizobium TaxID=2631580 RepID=UPI002915EE17|nr:MULTISPECIES: amino acid adenylation domain-containing protein [unclassified Bradyrhizobium]
MTQTRDESLVSVFLRQSNEHPEREAVRFAGRSLTYRDLDRRSYQFACHLRERGITRGACIAISLPPSPDLVVALLAILRVGAAYFPFDQTQPLARTARMQELAGANVWIVSEHALGGLRQDWPVITWPGLETDLDLLGDAENPESYDESIPEALAYILFTSGSTGQPKGVMVEHRQALNTIRAINRAIDARSTDRTLWITSATFDLSVYEIFGTLAVGATIIVGPPLLAKDPALCSALLIQEQVTIWDSVPSTLEGLIDFFRTSGLPDGLALRVLMVSGDVVGVFLAKEVRALFPRSRAFALGGATEASIWSTIYELGSAEYDDQFIPYGKALPDQSCFVLDEGMKPTAVGQVGELYIAGASVARGYVSQPELTDERFQIVTLAGAEERTYRTGDLVRQLPDGNLQFLGRCDKQVKIQGFRVELAEIEASLRRLARVRNAVAEVWPHGDHRGKSLVAFLEIEPAAPPTPDLRGLLRQELPEYMIPTQFVQLPTFPLTSNGKIDRAKLLEMMAASDPDLVVGSICYERDRQDDVENSVGEIWREILGVLPIDDRQSFAELGGNSLLAIRVLNRLRQRFGNRVPASAINATSTPSQVAMLLRSLTNDLRSEDEPLPLARRQREHLKYPLSASQAQIWYIARLFPFNSAYHFRASLRISGSLDTARLRACLENILDENEAYRVVFQSIGEEPFQILQRRHILSLDEIELGQHASDRQLEIIEREKESFFQEPFDLAWLPLIRWRLLKLGAGEYLLLHHEHHLVHDGWSFRLFLAQLEGLYNSDAQYLGNRGEPHLDFLDFCLWQRDWIRTAEARRQLAYWETNLAGYSGYLKLKRSTVCDSAQLSGRTREFALDQPLLQQILSVARRTKTTVFSVMLAAYAVIVARLSCQDDIVIGVGLANRTTVELEAVIGMIVNLVPVRLFVGQSESMDAVLARTDKAMAEATNHGQVPLSEIVRRAAPKRTAEKMPLVQVAFNFQNALTRSVRMKGLQVDVIEGIPNRSAKFDLNLTFILESAADPASVKKGMLEYNSSIFSEQEAQSIINAYTSLLAAGYADVHADAPLQWQSSIDELLSCISLDHHERFPETARNLTRVER